VEIRAEILWIILGTSIVTFIPRVLPLVVLSRMQLPDWGLRWLSYVPISVMAALVGQELLVSDGQFVSLRENLEVLAAIPAFLVAIFTRSLLGTVVIGIAALMGLRFLFL